MHHPVQKADKLDSKVGLDMWREKTGKEQHLDRDRAREANQATIDRKRRADSQRKAVELNGGVADDLEALAEEEAVLLDQKYAARDVAARKAELESMMADLDSKIEEQKQWQGSMQDALSKILEGYKMQERLSKFEEFSKEGATAEKAQVLPLRRLVHTVRVTSPGILSVVANSSPPIFWHCRLLAACKMLHPCKFHSLKSLHISHPKQT